MAAAKQLYRLMAYKDEYEVARLYSDGEFRRKLNARFEGDFELRFNLAPPLLSKRDPQTGELQKREFGPWMLTAFGWLARLRFLRGTPLDLFGYTQERRQERRDIDDYRELLASLLVQLNTQNYSLAAELAGSVAKLRGYGHVKDRNREQVRAEQARLWGRLRGDDGGGETAVRFVNAA
jgi:indolepyruvate ferredoxin oxidoreductase